MATLARCLTYNSTVVKPFWCTSRFLSVSPGLPINTCSEASKQELCSVNSFNRRSANVRRPSLSCQPIRSFQNTALWSSNHILAANTNVQIYRHFTKSVHDGQNESSAAKNLFDMDPNAFAQMLKEKKIRRAYILWDVEEKQLKASHPELEELATFFSEQCSDHAQHEGVFLGLGVRTDCLMGAFVWNTTRGQACGGVRFWQYKTLEDYLRDGLRLSVGMGVKSALAGLWVGGGKGVICEPQDNKHIDPTFRQNIFKDYGDFLTSLNGCYVGGEGLCVTEVDMGHLHSHTRFANCLPLDIGGRGNPSSDSAKGVMCAIEGALSFMKAGTVEGKVIAIQGAGNVAVVLIEELLGRDAEHIYVTDCHQNRVEDVKEMFMDSVSSKRLTVQRVPLDDMSVLSYPCDILSPCALGNVLHAETIPHIRAKVVCGAANNQLGNEADNQLLVDHNITYVPDFIANRMGLVNCANEAYGRLPDDPAISRHFDTDWEKSIYNMTKKILKKASKEQVTPAVAAMDVAYKLMEEMHPIWPNRGQQIIQGLIKSDWHLGHDYWR